MYTPFFISTYTHVPLFKNKSIKIIKLICLISLVTSIIFFRYVHFDFHQICGHIHFERLSILYSQIEDFLNKHGYVVCFSVFLFDSAPTCWVFIYANNFWLANFLWELVSFVNLQYIKYHEEEQLLIRKDDQMNFSLVEYNVVEKLLSFNSDDLEFYEY